MPPTRNGRGSLDPRSPVLVGVGTASADAEATDLMIEALLAAADDAGTRSVLDRIDRIAVPQGSWAYPDPARLVARGVGAPSARTHLVELGIPQQSLVNEAIEAIAADRSDVAVVVGGEAKRWARDLERSGRPAVEADQGDAAPDVTRHREGPLMEPLEVAHRLWDPVQQYAMIDNALRAAEGRSLDEHRSEVAELWSRFNVVARTTPDAAFPAPMGVEDITEASAGNRPLAFPYNKWHSTQWTGNQAAALVLCSVQAAGALGISADRWVFPLVGLESSHAVSLLARQDPHDWPAMGVLGRAAAVRLGRPVTEVDTVELYSCFPAAVRVQQRALGFDPSSTPTVTGGMAFAGGPFNNFVLQSLARVVQSVRADPGSLGMVSTVSGLLTKPGLGVWTAVPDARRPLVADLGKEARAATGVREVVPTLDGYDGRATVVTYTVTYDGMVPWRTVALCDTTDGRRCVAVVEDTALAERATTGELIGAPVELAAGSLALV